MYFNMYMLRHEYTKRQSSDQDLYLLLINIFKFKRSKIRNHSMQTAQETEIKPGDFLKWFQTIQSTIISWYAR